MSGIRKLRPDEFDAQGFPAFPVLIEPFSDDDDRSGTAWIAHCIKLPGYWGAAATRSEALARLERDFAKSTVCLVPRVKFDDPEATKRMLTYLRDQGGSDAPSEALKPRIGVDEKPLGFSPSDLFNARSKLKEAESILGVKIELTDYLITIASNFAGGSGGWAHGPLLRHLRARFRIARFLQECAAGGTE